MHRILADWQVFGDVVLNELFDADIIVFPRAAIAVDQSYEATAVLFTALRERGVKIIYEVDDDYTNEFRHVVDGDSLTPMKWADAVTVTTPYLASRLRQYTRQTVYVLPNCIDPAIWRDMPMQTERTDQDAVVIGLTGSPTHEGDWCVLETVMPQIMADHPNVYLVVMGYHPPYLAGLPRTKYLSAAGYVDYSQVIRACDIILAPVDPKDRFNEGKSPIKALEGQSAQRHLPGGQSAGAAVIATNNPIYSLVVKHEHTGLLTEQTPNAWGEALHRLIVDKELRERLQIQGFKAAYKNYDITRQYTLWSRAYHKVILSPHNPVSPPLLDLVKGTPTNGY